MKLSRPTVGPIVGFTTPNESRIWFRGQFEPVSPNSYRRCFGVIRWGEKTKKSLNGHQKWVSFHLISI